MEESNIPNLKYYTKYFKLKNILSESGFEVPFLSLHATILPTDSPFVNLSSVCPHKHI